ncbi:LRR receptor-like serine/threonine-protein kinase GSO1 isoform X2 [Daucus carota subsp. sativus]|uniref:LRR receptor-like serine/threonine-protein kinase GSO1 isoform X2 n=1 Tax=Daucus carota subsp. sativus TaxID=79200 RepID=UPI00308335C4
MKLNTKTYEFITCLCVLTYSKFGCGSITGGRSNLSCIENEKQALLLIKKSFIDDWKLLSSWVGDDCCSWYGIECDNLTGQVTKLYHGASGLKGSISASIGNLTALTVVDLNYNFLEGIIPESIGSLKSLTILDLSVNNLQGFIPQSIGSLTSLTILDLSQNKIGGLIPESIGALTSVTELHMSSNNLRGPIPQSIRNLTSLSLFHLSFNEFNSSIPPEIGNLKELRFLSLSTNKFSGLLTEAVCNLSKLEVLSVVENQLSGSIPVCIGELSKLVSLGLSLNSWEGFVSERHFAELAMLTELKLSSKSGLVMNVSDKWVPPFQLEDIWMDSLKLGPKFPRWLCTQRNIKELVMTNTSISDKLLALPNSVMYLDLSNNHLFGKFPAYLCNFVSNLGESLKEIHLPDNNLSGELPQCLGNLTFLEVLDVMNNNLSGNIPPLGSLGLLRNLNLHNNKFQGRLPLSFENLTGLVGLDVGKNSLSDVLPSWKSNFTSRLRKHSSLFGKSDLHNHK